MKPKLKECSGCGNTTVIWKAKTKDHGQMCKGCWIAYKAPESDDHDKVKAKAVQKKKRSPIAPISAKKTKELVEYRKVRDQFLKDNPVCMYPDCSSRDVELHHAAGRQGKLLTDARYFKSLCRTHHRITEENPDHAKELGLSTTRLDK